jgi:hypothetical protein
VKNLAIMKGMHYLLNNTSDIDSVLCFKPTTDVPSVCTLAAMTKSGGHIIFNTAFQLNSINVPLSIPNMKISCPTKMHP